MRIRCTLFLVILTIVSKGYSITIGQGDAQLTDNGNGYYTLKMDENNHASDTTRVLFTYSDGDITLSEITKGTFVPEIKDGKFSTNSSFDYEKGDIQIEFVVKDDQNIDNTFYLTINNIEDEPPELQISSCTLKENQDYDQTNTECKYTLTDPDGFIKNIKITFENTNDLEEIEEHFEFVIEAVGSDTVKTSQVYLTTKKQLDYEDITMYVLQLLVKDGGDNSASYTLSVSVDDVDDTPPIWTQGSMSQQFEEKKEYNFMVKAMDGDFKIRSPIIYKITKDEDEYCEINQDSGAVSVKSINRDEKDISDYELSIDACETKFNKFCTGLDITFYINDINDCVPEFVNIVSQNDTSATVDGKKVLLTFNENFNQDLDFTFDIKDKDTAVNGLFSLTLVDSENSEVNVADAFQVLPSAGMQSVEHIKVSVINPAKLNYEDPKWRKFEFTIKSTDTKNEDLTDSLSVNVELLDYFDEVPQWVPNSEYQKDVKETMKKGDTVITVNTEDADANDKITYSITGNILAINPDTGEVTVKVDNAFDYDKNTETTVQITATDLGNLKNTATLTLNILDVNNKAPTLSIENAIELYENQIKGTVLSGTITASDVDTDAELEASIDWESSYALKNYVEIKNDESGIDKIFKLKSTLIGGSPVTIQIQIVIDEDGPDYEIIDTVYLQITVTDKKNVVEGMGSISAKVPLNIKDLNDNKPVFVNLEKKYSVLEQAGVGTVVGVITATDKDVSSKVTYYIEADHDDYNWITVNEESGELSVNDNVGSYGVDADTDSVYALNYTCYANDSENISEIPLKISITITDLNNKSPVITVDNNVNIKEHSPKDTLVTKIHSEDGDRDEPFHTVECSFKDDDSSPKCQDAFSLTNDNQVLVKNSDNIDWVKTKKFTCNLKCIDNPNLEQSNIQNEAAPYTFSINVVDINNIVPEITTTDFNNANENFKNGDSVGKIEAKDDDGDKYSMLTFSLNSVEHDRLDKDAVKDLFELTMDKDDDKFCSVLIKDDLKDFYGTFTLTVQVQDCKGCSADEVVNKSPEKQLKLVVEPFNFNEPQFIFPTNEGEVISLDTYQEVQKPLNLYGTSSETLSDLSATDNEDNCTGKFSMKFQITETNPATNIFTISPLTSCTSQLQITSSYSSEQQKNQRYDLTITVTVKNGEPQADEAPYSATTKLSVVFLDVDADPSFAVTEFAFDFQEERDDLKKSLENSATFPGDISNDVYYSFNGDPAEAEFFQINSKTGEISLKKSLDFETQTEHKFKILASKNAGGQNTSPNANQQVTVTVLDVNDHAPEFKVNHYIGAVKIGMTNSYTVVTLEGTDIDSINEVFTFNLNDEFTTQGTGIQNIKKPFILDSNTGELKLNFEVTSTMSGYFTLNISITDEPDNFGLGPHTTTSSMDVFIITTDSTVDFKFGNTPQEVMDKQNEMTECIGNMVELTCSINTINQDTEITEENGNVTKAALYFLDADNGLVDKDTILKKVTDLNFFLELRKALSANASLLLLSFDSTNTADENNEEVLRVWLIGTAVVLGSCLLILIFLYILHTRRLQRRITNLTKPKFGSQDSGLNRIGVNAPNTNVHAVEGTNPVFNNEVRSTNFDQNSISSGDSGDLVGIEENPEFDLFNNEERDDDYI